jgi:hypothetical protein
MIEDQTGTVRQEKAPFVLLFSRVVVIAGRTPTHRRREAWRVSG